MITAPGYPQRFVTGRALFATANTNRDGTTGTYGTVYTAPGTVNVPGGGEGSVVESIVICATGTTTAGAVRIFRTSAGGTDLVREILVSAIVPSGTVKAWTIPSTEGADANGRLFLNLKLMPGEILKVNTHNAEEFRITAEIGLY